MFDVYFVNCMLLCFVSGGIGYYLASRKYAAMIASILSRGAMISRIVEDDSGTTRKH